MFGFWKQEAVNQKQEARTWERIAGERADEINGLRIKLAKADADVVRLSTEINQTATKNAGMRFDLAAKGNSLAAAELQLEAEQRDNERLKRDLDKAKLHVERCDIGVLATEAERDQAKRDLNDAITAIVRIAKVANVYLINGSDEAKPKPDDCDCRGVCPTAWDPDCKSCRPRYPSSHDLCPDFDRQDG